MNVLIRLRPLRRYGFEDVSETAAIVLKRRKTMLAVGESGVTAGLVGSPRLH